MLPQLPHFWPCCSDRGTWSSTNMSWRRVCSGDTELKALGMRALRNQHLPDNLTITPLWGRSTDIHHRAAPAGVGSSLNKWRCPTFLLAPWALTRELGADITPWRHWRNSQGRWIRSSQPSESSPLFKPSWSRIAIAHLPAQSFPLLILPALEPIAKKTASRNSLRCLKKSLVFTQISSTDLLTQEKPWPTSLLTVRQFWLQQTPPILHLHPSNCSSLADHLNPFRWFPLSSSLL